MKQARSARLFWFILLCLAGFALVILATVLPTEQPQQQIPTPSASTNKPQQPAERSIKNQSELTKEAFSIFGMQIGDRKEQFIAKHGESLDEDFIDGEQESLFVMQYPDFEVGFNSANEAQFITVTAVGLDPGLGGIAIGSSAEDIVPVYGTPTNLSEHGITYERNGQTLKFDLDPQSLEVSSIKLFRN